MTTFKINQPTHPLHGREFPEYTAFRRYNGGVMWIPLLIGDKQVKFFALCNLREVEAPRVPNMTDLDYCYPQPCTALTIWRPTIEVPITELGFFKPGSKQEAIPGLQLHMSNVRVVLTLPEAA